MSAKETIHVRITKATALVWEGDAQAVSSQNVDGPFDILPYHANFVTLIRGVPITIKLADGSVATHNFKYAVIHTIDNVVKIYADFM